MITAADIIKAVEDTKPAPATCTLEEWMCSDGTLRQIFCADKDPALQDEISRQMQAGVAKVLQDDPIISEAGTGGINDQWLMGEIVRTVNENAAKRKPPDYVITGNGEENRRRAGVVLKVDLPSDYGFTGADIESVNVNGVEFVRKP